jgi:hypothetical protein
MTGQNLGKVERGVVSYNQVLLENMAIELRCSPADLIMRDPADPEGLWSILEGLAPTERTQAVRLIQAIKGTGTDG